MSRAMLVLAALACLAGCGEGTTQVVVTIDAESTWSAAATDLHIVVRGADGDSDVFDAPARDVTLQVGGDGSGQAFPIDVTIAPRDGDSARRWSVEATAVTVVGSHVATVRARGRYVHGRTARVELVLENACDNVVCTAEQTCEAGDCVAVSDTTPMSDGGVDAGTSDAGADAGDIDGGVVHMCPGTTPYVPDANADTLGYGAAAYPLPATCNNLHTPGQLCNPGVPADGVCYREQIHDVSYCRTPCAAVDRANGVTPVQAVCTNIHPDSRCARLQGYMADVTDWYCTIACNPYDDVGCNAGDECIVDYDSTGESLITDCVPLPTSPGYQNAPCADDGSNGPWPGGCAPGYSCRFEDICQGPESGYACLQLCDPAFVGSVLACPTGFVCSASGQMTRTIGPLEYGFCVPQ